MTTVSVITLDRISDALESIDLLEEMRSAFIAYSSGRAVIPPVGELIIDESPPGEVHIKYGYVRGGEHYVVKIASGFPGNHTLGLPPGNGMMILFDVTSGGRRSGTSCTSCTSRQMGSDPSAHVSHTTLDGVESGFVPSCPLHILRFGHDGRGSHGGMT